MNHFTQPLKIHLRERSTHTSRYSITFREKLRKKQQQKVK